MTAPDAEPSPARPGEVDPAYGAWAGPITDWLDAPFTGGTLLLSEPEPVTFTTEPSGLHAPAPTIRTLTKQKATAPAPYVGRPFAYVWYVAIDDQGRQVAGEARIRHTVDEHTWDKLNPAEGPTA